LSNHDGKEENNKEGREAPDRLQEEGDQEGHPQEGAGPGARAPEDHGPHARQARHPRRGRREEGRRGAGPVHRYPHPQPLERCLQLTQTHHRDGRFHRPTKLLRPRQSQEVHADRARRFRCLGAHPPGKITSIRDLFYHCKHTIEGTKENTFDDQSESDVIIEDLEVAIASLREELGLFAEPKGAMVGPMVIEDKGDTIDLQRMGSGGYAVPSIVEGSVIKFKKHTAKFVLLIEKGAVWRRFNEDRFWEKHKCLILHGGGQPPRGVRRLLWRLHHELNLPVYVLVDNDPWGYYIYSVIKQGSISLAFESNRIAIPEARFVGMSSYDAKKFDIPPAVSIKINEQDARRAKEIRDYPWFAKKSWQREINHMLKLGVKLELEALSAKDFSFITETYLPEKLRTEDFLD